MVQWLRGPGRRSLLLTMSKMVPGFEQKGLMWEDSSDTVVLSLPVTKEDLKTLEVSTDGSTVTFRSDKDQVRFCPFVRDETRLPLLLSA